MTPYDIEIDLKKWLAEWDPEWSIPSLIGINIDGMTYHGADDAYPAAWECEGYDVYHAERKLGDWPPELQPFAEEIEKIIQDAVVRYCEGYEA